MKKTILYGIIALLMLASFVIGNDLIVNRDTIDVEVSRDTATYFSAQSIDNLDVTEIKCKDNYCTAIVRLQLGTLNRSTDRGVEIVNFYRPIGQARVKKADLTDEQVITAINREVGFILDNYSARVQQREEPVKIRDAVDVRLTEKR